MSYQEFQDNWRIFSEFIEKIPTNENDPMNNLIRQYINQNLILLNEVFTTSIEHLTQLQKAKSTHDIICTQAKFTNEISKKLSLSTQWFLNTSLGHIADYNEWLKAHCDLATD
ncbi:MAG: hypothetical protein KIT56_04020 [Gammaproteobacteria bacterium]|nr:hypothetical protein [Gammaproteobacteria bacterium]MCW5583043.1 hypothetical protein [Gammaproteobacteria bacterium]